MNKLTTGKSEGGKPISEGLTRAENKLLSTLERNEVQGRTAKTNFENQLKRDGEIGAEAVHRERTVS